MGDAFRDTFRDTFRDWTAYEVDFTHPSTARMYDYYLGGKDNYEVDREAAEHVIAEHPQQQRLALNNRGFLARAVRHIAGAGIDQFIDIGTGIPTSPNVHEVARETHPGARAVYVDNDPVVLAHNRGLLATDENLVTIDANMRYPGDILSSSELNQLVDFSQPVAVLLVSVLHFVPGDEAHHIVARFREAMAPGSYLVASLGTSEGLSGDEIAGIEAAYASTSSGGVLRTRSEIEDLFSGFELADPGVVDVAQWRASEPETHVSILGGVGRATRGV